MDQRRAATAGFRAALLAVPPLDRDAWVDRALGLDEVLDDGPALPAGCTPYLPCAVDAVLRVIDLAAVGADDVFVDIGAGAGRAAALVHLLTGASAIGIEIQPHLVAAARALTARLASTRLTWVEGDAVALAGSMTRGTVVFLYCPFSGPRLAAVLDALAPIARARPLRVCTVDLPLPPRPWLALEAEAPGGVAIYRSAGSDEP